MERVAYFWSHLNTERGKTLPPLGLSLPYFSKLHGRFVGEFAEQLMKDIITALSAERRGYAYLYIDTVWVAVDLLALLCEAYDMSPGVSAQTVRQWRDTAIELNKEVYGIEWDETDPLSQDILAAFDQLEAVAQKHSNKW